MNSIKNVEIFRAGRWHTEQYTEADLDDMVDAFGQVGYRPPLKIGHSGPDKPGAPAYGWVSALRRVGTKLVADFTDIHDSVIDAIRNRSYDTVSAEIYWGLNRAGKTFRRALKAVALLGADVPAVAGLKPLHKMEFAFDAACDAVIEMDLTLDGVEMERENFRADLEVDRRAQRRMLDTGNRNYEEALDYVLADDPQLAKQYAEQQDASAVRTYSRARG